MLKRVVLVSLMLMALAVGVSHPQAVGAYSCSTCSAYATHTVNVRSTPHLSGSILTTVAAGTQLEWFPASGISADGYVRVASGGTNGYAFADYLKLYPLAGKTTAALNLRLGAGTSFGIILVMPAGAGVTVIAGPVNGFQNVEYNGTIGWASATWLSFVDPNVSWYTGETPETLANLRLRSGGGTAFSTLAILPAGTTVKILSGPTFGNGYSWYRVSTVAYGTGYVAGQFLGY